METKINPELLQELELTVIKNVVMSDMMQAYSNLLSILQRKNVDYHSIKIFLENKINHYLQNSIETSFKLKLLLVIFDSFITSNPVNLNVLKIK